MSDIICVTNRLLCRDDFLQRVEKIAAMRPAAVILREKDLSESEYEALAEKVLKICRSQNVPCILHSFVNTAKKLGVRKIHLPLPLMRKLSGTDKAYFETIGASCHSTEEAIEAEALGCTYVTAGHVFATDCKKGLPPRGTDFLRKVCESVEIPVLAIGGINEQNGHTARQAGAKGICIMSPFMTRDM